MHSMMNTSDLQHGLCGVVRDAGIARLAAQQDVPAPLAVLVS